MKKSRFDSKNQAPLENIFKKIATPFEQFTQNEAAGGLVLMFCAIVALLVANLGFYEFYQHLLHTPLSFSLGDYALEKSLHHWINDGLMALFFLLVGLEIKREILDGELSGIRQAAFPLAAAVGGMVVPALVYVAFNAGSPLISGWGIPMATDIAFAVGVLVLLGARVPSGLLTFLVALAIVDDLGAVLVIALFYTEQINMSALMYGVLFTGVLILFNLFGIRRILPYLLVGALLWLALLKSGVHATLAGVITAFLIPARTKFDPALFGHHVRKLMDNFDANYHPEKSLLRNQEQQMTLSTLQDGLHLVKPPLQSLEHALLLPVAFLIVPIFALANAGVPIAFSQIGNVITDPVTMGVILGLVLGKPIGIAGFAWLAVKLGLASLPTGTRFIHIIGVGFLGGIGFTMSIFIAELGFTGNTEALILAKTGILFASLIAGVAGYVLLKKTLPEPQPAKISKVVD